MATAEIKRHWARVAQLGCIVTGLDNPTIHHVHGGSVADLGVQKGMGRKVSDWLVIPICHSLHVGDCGIDYGMGIRTWEEKFGKQADHLDEVCRRLGYNCWKKAGIDRDVVGVEM